MARFTNFPNGITSLGIPTFGTFGLPPFTGNYFWVKETTTAGVSAGRGTVESPFNTFEQALAECTAGNNDVILLEGTVHATASIAWSKNNTHLYGVCAPIKRGKRARVSVSGSTPWSYLFNVTASGCQFQNFGTFYGFSTVGSTTPICWLGGGGRNFYGNVEFLGFGDGTASTGTSNQTGARSFLLSNSVGETTFRSCVFGVDTVARGAANYNLEIAGGAPRITFDDCNFEAYAAAGGAGGGFLLVGSGGIDRWVEMNGCLFHNASVGSGATAFTQGMNISGTAGGDIILDERCRGVGFTKWETSASGRLLASHATIATALPGVAVAPIP